MSSPNLIAISGKKRSGKNTVATMINRILEEGGKQKYAEKAFATLVKKFASELTGIPLEGWETEEDKAKELGHEWDTFDQYGIKIPMTRRLFLKKLGTDACNMNLHKNTWINGLFKDYLPVDAGSVFAGPTMPNWLVTDCRFPQEAKAIKDRKGIIIRVDNPRVDHTDTHQSEVGLDTYKEFDYTVLNDGTLADLEQKVRFIVFSLKLV